MRYLFVLLCLSMLMVSGCGVITGQTMSESLEDMRANNRTGCVQFIGSGTPPASRVDLKVVTTWGDEVTFKDCVEVLQGVN